MKEIRGGTRGTGWGTPSARGIKEKGKETSKEHKREQLLGTFVVKRGKHTSKELTVIRPPEKQLVAWSRRGAREKTRDVILASTAGSSCSPAPTQSHFVFLFAGGTNRKKTGNLEVSLPRGGDSLRGSRTRVDTLRFRFFRKSSNKRKYPV